MRVKGMGGGVIYVQLLVKDRRVMSDEKSYLTTRDVAEALRVSRGQVNKLIKRGEIDAERIKRWQYAISPDALASYIAIKRGRGRPRGFTPSSPLAPDAPTDAMRSPS